ncbi:MAG TPA: IclR family transcriptional regulator C-terminal domain-containing protein, partial [Rhizomicrobium sp.]|nr:IclR family transcriptional regulator C-terminal domain-containing protein [Rhizomicrobium sp.]
GDFVALTPQTITTITGLRTEISTIRQRGYAVDNREAFHTIACVGAPVRDPSGCTIAAISLADSAEKLSSGWQEEVAGLLISVAETISRKIFPVYARVSH